MPENQPAEIWILGAAGRIGGRHLHRRLSNLAASRVCTVSGTTLVGGGQRRREDRGRKYASNATSRFLIRPGQGTLSWC